MDYNKILGWMPPERKEELEKELSKKKPKGCECGAKHTTFPNFHSDWCPLYEVKSSEKNDEA